MHTHNNPNSVSEPLTEAMMRRVGGGTELTLSPVPIVTDVRGIDTTRMIEDRVVCDLGDLFNVQNLTLRIDNAG